VGTTALVAGLDTTTAPFLGGGRTSSSSLSSGVGILAGLTTAFPATGLPATYATGLPTGTTGLVANGFVGGVFLGGGT